ncbi:MAG: hypothetical protein J6I68_04045 [Butyrivibrio sp.]|uniref:hypothetical protein n=1 Tax=Butyrivibrio sp. TaxID=28121 RepID=UPI001B455A31|nr:hypothetical protein [Butyrivibrio sp.]MBP3782399.1 hypothetical protein [Butyrivibrio sp.]
MENMIITQDRNIAVNLRYVYTLEVRSSSNIPNMYELIARTSVQSDFTVLGAFSRKDMAIDVRNDIILWNNQNYDWEWHIEYTVPQDDPEYMSARDAIELPAAKRLIDDNSVQSNKAATR